MSMVSVILGGMKILLTSSSRHGSTDEVAAVIAERLQAAKIDVDIKRPEDVDVVDGYDAFILGSAVYMTKWTPEAVDFTERFHEPLKARPVWAFSVGLSGLPKGKVSDPMRIGPVLLAIDPEDHVTFPGRFDPSKLSLRNAPSPGWGAPPRVTTETGTKCVSGPMPLPPRSTTTPSPLAEVTADAGVTRKVTVTARDCISMQLDVWLLHDLDSCCCWSHRIRRR